MDRDNGTADLAVLVHLERQILTRSFAGQIDIADRFKEDFVEVGQLGSVYRKPETLAALIGAEASARGVADDTGFETRPLSPDIALVTDVSFRRYDDGRTDRYSLRSSIWRRTEERWRMLFHQATPMTSAGR